MAERLGTPFARGFTRVRIPSRSHLLAFPSTGPFAMLGSRAKGGDAFASALAAGGNRTPVRKTRERPAPPVGLSFGVARRLSWGADAAAALRIPANLGRMSFAKPS